MRILPSLAGLRRIVADRAPLIPRLPVLRWTVLVALLVAEFVGLSMAYDAADRSDDPGWAGLVIAKSPKVIRVGMVAGLVTAVVAGWYLGREILAAARAQTAATGWRFAAGHLAAFGLFALATERVLGPSTLDTPVHPADLCLWLMAGVLTGVLWLAAIVPPRAWPRLARLGWAAILGGLLVAGAGLLFGQAFQMEWDLLARPTLWVSHQLLHLVTADTIYDPATHRLGAGSFWVYVTPPCSGYEGLGLMCAYLGGYLCLFRRSLRWPHALILLPIGLVAVWLANAVRIAALVIIGDRVSPHLAVGGFHSQAGWLGFSVVALGVVWLSHRWRAFSLTPASRTEASTDPTIAYLAPLLAAIAVQMLTVAFVPAPEAWYPMRAGAAAVLLVWFWQRFEGLRIPPSAGSLFGIAAGTGVFVVWLALARILPPSDVVDPRAVVDGWPSWAAGVWLTAWVAGFVLVTPLAEELAFRGYLMRRLVAADFDRVPVGRFTWPSFIVSSVLFGLLHGQWLAGTLAGLAYAGVVYRTGRLRDAVVAHAVTNGLLAVLGFATGHWA